MSTARLEAFSDGVMAIIQGVEELHSLLVFEFSRRPLSGNSVNILLHCGFRAAQEAQSDIGRDPSPLG
jgi:uncharacterized membrane protein